MVTYENYVLSYGILNATTYSLNVHNYKTKELVSKRTTYIKIHEFICLN
jgi:hypothetical protein